MKTLILKIGLFTDVNECTIPGTCSQQCENVKGGYKCSCIKGYILDPKGRYCRAEGREPYLLFANRHDLREIRLDSGDYRAVVAETRSAIAIDFDYAGGYVYWSDVAQEMIFRARYNHTHPAEENQNEVMVSDLTTPDGIALDWIHKLLYWTDTGRNTIEVIDLRSASKHRKTLFTTDLDEPRAIVVDPRTNHGWIYWSDWGTQPKIERAGMDGNHRTAIITTEMQWPNGLTIDYVSDKLFWVDAKLHTIMAANLDGSQITVVLTSMNYLRHPFSISVFEDTLYWTDWQTESIHKTNKFNGSNVENVAISLFSPMDIHVFHELKQPMDEARCSSNNGGCSHLCLPAPALTSISAKYSCACPDNWQMTSDGLTCEIIASPSTIPMITVDTTEKNTGPNSSGNGKLDGKYAVPPSEQFVGTIAGIVAGSIIGLALVAFIVSINNFFNKQLYVTLSRCVVKLSLCVKQVGVIIHRSIMRKNIQSMNFDNPVYRKTTEDQFSLEKNQYQPSRLPPVSFFF